MLLHGTLPYIACWPPFSAVPQDQRKAALQSAAVLCCSVLPPPPASHSWHTYRLLVYMHEVPDLSSKAGGIRRLDRYDQLAEYVFGECTATHAATSNICASCRRTATSSLSLGLCKETRWWQNTRTSDLWFETTRATLQPPNPGVAVCRSCSMTTGDLAAAASSTAASASSTTPRLVLSTCSSLSQQQQLPSRRFRVGTHV